MCAALLVLLIVSAVRGLKSHRAELVRHGREISIAELTNSAFVESHRSLYARNWPATQVVAVHLKTEWTCGALLRPLSGDPQHRSQRLFVSICIVISSAAINLLFHQVGDPQELCDEPCTSQQKNDGLCTCSVFDCASEGCDCAFCTSTRQCAKSCRLVVDPGLTVPILTASILIPLHGVLK
jgi:hypothetical protein